MILNPSHEITLKGLPSEILDAYVRYKKGSRAIVSWLIQFKPHKYKKVKTLPIKELANLARSVTDCVKELPEVVHFHFRETIAARKRLSQYFRKSIDLSEDDPDTVNHEHFTTSLTRIYSELCEHCRDCQKRSQPGSVTEQIGIAEPIRNHYACLPVEGSFEALHIDDNDTECDACQHEQVYQCPSSQNELRIENDEISEAIETASILERIHDTVIAAESTWERAGRGDVNFVTASGVTNVAWTAIRDLEHQLRDDNETLSLGVLHRRCCLFGDAANDSNSALVRVHELLESLKESDQAVAHYSNCHKLKVIAHCPSCVQKPHEYIQETVSAQSSETTSFSIAIVDNILHLMCGPRPTSIIVQGSPIFAEIGYLLTHREDKSTHFRCVLAVHLLTTVYKAHLSTLPRPTTISMCRITALKLSKQASSTIEQVLSDKDSFPCRCAQTIAYHLSNLKDDMDAYAKYKAWDLYFQSPWVTGNHVIEILDMLSYYGMRLFHYRHYAGAILHSYNVLTQFGGLARIPILDRFIETFKDIFFPSGIPTTHFKNSWARYIGARLKFQKGHRRHGNDRDSWCMAVPAHAARNAAGLGIEADRKKESVDPKCDFARIDPMMKLKHIDWRVDISTTDQPSSSPSPRPSSSSSSSSSILTKPTSNTSLSTTATSTSTSTNPHPLTALTTTLTSALSPTTTLNHLAIFLSFLRATTQITTRTHTTESEKSIKNCICFAHTLLGGADRIVEGRRFGGVECWKKDEQEVVRVVKEVVMQGFANDGLHGEWVWDV